MVKVVTKLQADILVYPIFEPRKQILPGVGKIGPIYAAGTAVSGPAKTLWKSVLNAEAQKILDEIHIAAEAERIDPILPAGPKACAAIRGLHPIDPVPVVICEQFKPL